MFIQSSHKRKKLPFILGGVFIALLLLGIGAYVWLRNQDSIDIITLPVIEDIVRSQVGSDAADAVALLPEVLGYTKPRTYLFLFENNTELRPGGGFIGIYALIRVEKGHLSLVRVEGSDTLDARTPKDWKPIAPKPIREHLGVDRWYFRDSNWSPDFGESTKKALELYRAEGGAAPDEIDAVVGITPTILEEFLRLTGPVTVDGITFSDADVVEKLEYEVEYGFQKRGLSVEERKQIIRPLTHAILVRLNDHIVTSYKRYIVVVQRLIQEKQVMLYTLDPKLQTLALQFDALGQVRVEDGDSLLWVDANLAALKTDHAVQRTLHYTVAPDKDGAYLATATMTYTHKGTFDWRTTRYRTYARVYVPEGATLVRVEGAMKTDRSSLPGTVDQGEELGKQWFGAFIAIEPGNTGTLRFTYRLPQSVTDMVKNGSYLLRVQKQLGSKSNGLTLSLNFDRTSTASTPKDAGKEGDGRYEYTGDLRVDREFIVTMNQ